MMIAWSLFIPACFALNCAPGPNNMLAFANTARFGVARGFLGGMGRMPAFVILIAITVAGLGVVLATSAAAFMVVKILGALYLIYVGIRMWRAAATAAATATPGRLTELMRRDFTIAISNPKAIAIFTAFFPQFIDASQAAWSQLVAMGAVFLLLEVGAVAVYVVGGALFGAALKSTRAFAWLNRGVGAFLIASGGSLALSSR